MFGYIQCPDNWIDSEQDAHFLAAKQFLSKCVLVKERVVRYFVRKAVLSLMQAKEQKLLQAQGFYFRFLFLFCLSRLHFLLSQCVCFSLSSMFIVSQFQAIVSILIPFPF